LYDAHQRASGACSGFFDVQILSSGMNYIADQFGISLSFVARTEKIESTPPGRHRKLSARKNTG
jgi:hypothetical protein